MLKLKKVQILGFKSFCDRTEVQLAGNGIAAIVGPNGCGKSNISDAITWVLGEQSAKSLRGVKMEDVIFAGTRERRPTGMAEVSLTLVDPEVYDGTADTSDAPDVELSSRTPADGIADWDEAGLREQNAAETDEAVADAQPGTVLNPEEVDPTAEGNVVLKVRRRKFGRTPIRAGELTITRRLFRSGDSEYLLNGKICRLRDIQDIFLGTGLGGESYAIIGQERIGQLLSAKPQDRRAIIEEAAGITRFKTKKRLAELRLESARQNLARVNDIFEEVSKQIVSLKRQAAKAERYGQIRDELRTRLRVVLASRMAEYDREQGHIAGRLAELSTTIDGGAARLEQLDAAHAEGVRSGYTLDQQLREAATTANQTAVELERVSARAAANQDRIAELTARLEAGAAELDAARAQLATLADEQAGQRAFVASATAEAAASRDNASREQTEAQAAARAVEQREQQAEHSRRASMQMLERAGRIRSEQAQAEAALASLERESERLVAESAVARQELAALGKEQGQAKLSFETVTERLKRVELAIAELRLTIEAGRTAESSSRREGDRLRGEVASLRGRQSSLEGLIRDHSYSTDTVKNIFRATAKRSSQTGVAASTLGTLADFLEVDGAYEQVVDEFLRDELNYVVVKSWDAAEEGIKLLRSDVAGRATFLVEPSEVEPSEVEPSGAQPAQAAQSAPPLRATQPKVEGVRPLTECVRVLNGFGHSLERLLPKLREGFVVPDARQARELALAHPEGYFLASTGETFHGTTVTGGRPSSGGPLALKRELKEVDGKLKAAEQQLALADLESARLQQELRTQSAALETHNAERREAEREAANSGAALRQMQSETARIEKRLEQWMLSTDRNRDARNAKADQIAAQREQAAGMEQERATLESQLAALTAQVTGLRADRERLQHAAARAAAALAGLEERRRNAQANYEQTARLHQGQQQRLATLEQQLAAAAQERGRREQETASLAGEHMRLSGVREEAIARNTTLTGQAHALREQTAALDQQLRALRTETDALREQRATLATRGARLAADLEYLEGTCANDLGVPASHLRADETIARIAGEPLTTEETEARTLKQKLEAMGPVNMMALEEFAEASERHGFLETQRKDLIDSIENTTASIKEIDDVSRVKFDEAYKVINENFAGTFAKLFGGGQAFMRLTDPDNANSDSSGIEIVASPPGKKLQNILLLSGGEKALTALSLLVAIFQFQPAPFCILDEVDAPLDETNVGRYARMIADMSATTQFIAITHNKRTMAEADVIYGVTMQEPGVSKIVSVNLGQSNRSRAA